MASPMSAGGVGVLETATGAPESTLRGESVGAKGAEETAAAGTAAVASGLRIHGLYLTLGGQTVLHGVELDVPAGSYTCVLGASGAGKSTLLKAVAGILRPTRGRIELAGEVLSDAESGLFRAPSQRRLGMVFQDYLLWPHLSAEQNVALPLRARLGRRAALARAGEWLARVGLDGLGKRYPAQLSGGQQQRVALARALAVEPRLVLLDEPLSALDVDRRVELRDLLRRLAAELSFTALHVTHDVTEALTLADQLVVMSDGQVVQSGPSEKVFMRPANQQVARLTGATNLLPVRVLERHGEHAWVELGASRLRVGCHRDLTVGHDALLVLRPQALSCRPLERASPLRARLLDACFLGDHWRVEAQLEHGARVTLHHDHRPDHEFEIYLRPERAWLVTA